MTTGDRGEPLAARFPCPCCGHRVFDREPGCHQICPICGWEDDLSQLRFALIPGSSNTVSLREAQINNQIEFRFTAPVCAVLRDVGLRRLGDSVGVDCADGRGRSCPPGPRRVRGADSF